MDRLCTRCVQLRKLFTTRTVKVRSVTTLQKRWSKQSKTLTPLVNLPRQFATNERTSEQIYRHGKLVIEEEEDLQIYVKLLLILSGTDEAVLDHYFHFVKKAAKLTEVNVTKSFTMPAIEEEFKAKREGEGLQKEIVYNFKQYQRIIEVSDLPGDKSDFFLEYIQQSLPAGVKIKLEKRYLLSEGRHDLIELLEGEKEIASQ